MGSGEMSGGGEKSQGVKKVDPCNLQIGDALPQALLPLVNLICG
jgi:hypothetical protein